jgi:hypothetical protein
MNDFTLFTFKLYTFYTWLINNYQLTINESGLKSHQNRRTKIQLHDY